MILASLVCIRTTWRSQFWSSRSRIGPKNLHSYKLQVTLTLLVHGSHSGEHHSEGLQSFQSMAISPELTSFPLPQGRLNMKWMKSTGQPSLPWPLPGPIWWCGVAEGILGMMLKGDWYWASIRLVKRGIIKVIPSHFYVASMLGVLVQELLLGWSYHPFCWRTNTDQTAHALESLHSTNPQRPVGGVGRNKVWNGICGECFQSAALYHYKWKFQSLQAPRQNGSSLLLEILLVIQLKQL